MKKIMLISIFIVLMSCLSYTQGLEETFTAKEAINDVIAKAKSEGITDPVLLGVGLAPGEYAIPGIGTLSPELDITNGQSSIWLYMVAEKTNITNSVNIAVIKFFNGFIAMPIDIDLSSIPINYIDPLTINWIDTDVLCQKLNSNTKFSNFVKDDQANFDFVTLDYETSDELSEMGNLEVGPYWLISCSKDNGESIFCYTEAVSGVTTCFNTTSVEEDDIIENFTIFPNPAKEQITIEKVSSDSNSYENGIIIDSKGYIVEKFTLENAKMNTINIQELPNGNYTLIIGEHFKRFIKVN